MLLISKKTLGLGLVLGLLSCEPSSFPTDGGMDAADADRDAARDGGRDATRIRPDVPRDSGEVTTWTRIATSLPDFCTLERADHPERIPDVQLVWAPCEERDNCLTTAPLGGGVETDWLAASDGYALGRYEDSSGRRHLALVPLDGGTPLAVFRSDAVPASPGCAIRAGDLGEGRVAFAVRLRAATNSAAFFVSTIGEAATIDEPLLHDVDHYGIDFPQALYVSSTALIAEVQPVNLLVSIEEGPFEPIFVDDDFYADPERVHVFGETVLWIAWSAPPYLATGSDGVRGGSHYRHQAPWQIGAMWTDGTTLSWMAFEDIRGSDGMIVSRNHELWTAAYQTDPALLAPRRVRGLRTWGFPTGSPEHWATATSLGEPGTSRVEIVDLVDGRMRVYETPGTTGTREAPLVVEADRIVYPAGAELIQFDPRLVPYVAE